MRLAAEFWSQVRRAGLPTADPQALDADCILAAQATLLGGPGDDIVIATTNVGHLVGPAECVPNLGRRTRA